MAEFFDCQCFQPSATQGGGPGAYIYNLIGPPMQGKIRCPAVDRCGAEGR